MDMKPSSGEKWPPEVRVPHRRRPVRRGWDFALGVGVAILLVVVIGTLLYAVEGTWPR